jgi:hypothetical protein
MQYKFFSQFLFPYQHIIKDETTAQSVQDLQSDRFGLRTFSLFTQATDTSGTNMLLTNKIS